MRSIFSALVQKNGRLQRMPVPGCINSQEARRQAEKMYDGKIVQIQYHGIDHERDDENLDESHSNSHESTERSWEEILGLCLLLAITMVAGFIIEYWAYILGGLVVLAIVVLAMYFNMNRG